MQNHITNVIMPGTKFLKYLHTVYIWYIFRRICCANGLFCITLTHTLITPGYMISNYRSNLLANLIPCLLEGTAKIN